MSIGSMNLLVVGCGSFGWVDVGLGGNCDCRCGILYAHMLGVAVHAGFRHII